MNAIHPAPLPPSLPKSQPLNGVRPVEAPLASKAAVKQAAPPLASPNQSAPATASPKRGGKTKVLGWGALVLLLVGTCAFYYLRYAGQFAGTDDAYLDGNLHPISARVNGTVAEVLTDDNRPAQLGEASVRDALLQLPETSGSEIVRTRGRFTGEGCN